jgi:hypothetical protein
MLNKFNHFGKFSIAHAGGNPRNPKWVEPSVRTVPIGDSINSYGSVENVDDSLEIAKSSSVDRMDSELVDLVHLPGESDLRIISHWPY